MSGSARGGGEVLHTGFRCWSLCPAFVSTADSRAVAVGCRWTSGCRNRFSTWLRRREATCVCWNWWRPAAYLQTSGGVLWRSTVAATWESHCGARRLASRVSTYSACRADTMCWPPITQYFRPPARGGTGRGRDRARALLGTGVPQQSKRREGHYHMDARKADPYEELLSKVGRGPTAHVRGRGARRAEGGGQDGRTDVVRLHQEHVAGAEGRVAAQPLLQFLHPPVVQGPDLAVGAGVVHLALVDGDQLLGLYDPGAEVDGGHGGHGGRLRRLLLQLFLLLCGRHGRLFVPLRGLGGVCAQGGGGAGTWLGHSGA